MWEIKTFFSTVPNERLFQDQLIGKFADPFSANLHFPWATFFPSVQKIEGNIFWVSLLPSIGVFAYSHWPVVGSVVFTAFFPLQTRSKAKHFRNTVKKHWRPQRTKHSGKTIYRFCINNKKIKISSEFLLCLCLAQNSSFFLIRS